MKLHGIFCIVFCVLSVSCTRTAPTTDTKNEETIMYVSNDTIQHYLDIYQKTIQKHDSLVTILQRTIHESERLVQLKYRANLTEIEYKVNLLRKKIVQFTDSSQVTWNNFQDDFIEENTKIESSLHNLFRTLENL